MLGNYLENVMTFAVSALRLIRYSHSRGVSAILYTLSGGNSINSKDFLELPEKIHQLLVIYAVLRLLFDEHAVYVEVRVLRQTNSLVFELFRRNREKFKEKLGKP